MRVRFVGASPAFESTVRQVVGGGARIEALLPGKEAVEADLIVIEASQVTARMLAEIRGRLGDTPILVLPGSALAANLRLQQVPPDLAKMTYRAVMDQLGPHAVADYLEALLRRHQGNITKAALAAHVERESLHRLLRRHGIRSQVFRKPPLEG